MPEVRTEALSRDEIEQRIRSRLGRKIVVVGACTGDDAHTVGIDAILNYKGYAGDKGLESYKGFEVYNLGAQVENAELAARARALRADVILVSQVVTQRNCHKQNGAAAVEMARREGWRGEVIMVLGGPRIDHKLAVEIGLRRRLRSRDHAGGRGVVPRRPPVRRRARLAHARARTGRVATDAAADRATARRRPPPDRSARPRSVAWRGTRSGREARPTRVPRRGAAQ